MEPTIESMAMYGCQRSKEVIWRNKREYLDFVSRIMNDRKIEKAMNALLPFDNFIIAQLRIVDVTAQIKSMGIFIMRMELEPATFSIGIGLEFGGSRYNKGSKPTEFIIGYHLLEQIREYVKTTEFSRQVTETFDQLVENCYFPKGNDNMV